MNHFTRRNALKATGLALCSAMLGGAAGNAMGEETATPPGPNLRPPPVAPEESRAAQVKWYQQFGVSPGRRLLAVYGNIYGVSPEIAFKISGGLSGGLGHTGEACCTLTAAIMLLGLKHESENVGRQSDKDAHKKTIALAKQFTDDFREKHGAVTCRELLQHDISTPELYALVSKVEGLWDICYKSLDTIIDLLENKYDILNRNKETPS